MILSRIRVDPEEYEDDETKDGLVDYPMDERDNGDEDDDNSSGDDADDEDDGDEDEAEEEEEHLAPTDSAIIVPGDKPVFPPEGTKPIISPPSTDITIGARIIVIPQASISLPLEAEVERLLAMTTPSPSPPISLSPPSAEERLVRSMAPLHPHIHHPPLLRITITSTTTLPPSHIHTTTVVCRDDIPEYEAAPARSLYLFYPRLELRGSGRVSTARPTEISARERDLYVLLEDAQDSRSRISQRVDMDSQRVDLLMGDRMTLQETVWMVEEEAYASLEAWAHSIGLSQAIHQELQTHRDHVYAHETHLQAHQTQLQLQGTPIQTQHQAQMVETLQVIRDMRREMSDIQTELLSLREQQRRARQPGPEARIPDHQDASGDANSHI
ncbi:hypothetical protein Tco_1061317 [Tanacetum coccineum]